MDVSPADHDRQRLGFPSGTAFLGLHVSVPARCLIVLAARKADPTRSDRIYVREFSGSVYREVPWADGCNSWGNPLVSHCAPELFVLGETWRDSAFLPSRGKPGGTSRGGNTAGLYRVPLPSGQPELLHAAEFKPDADSDAGHWRLSALHGLTPDGARLVVSAATGRRDSGTTKWDYGVAIFDPASGQLEPCAELPAVFA